MVDLISPLGIFLHCWMINSVHSTFPSLLVLETFLELSWNHSSDRKQSKPSSKQPKEQRTKYKFYKESMLVKRIGHRPIVYRCHTPDPLSNLLRDGSMNFLYFLQLPELIE
jgi:hypothetical protein